ncbi:MAG: WYL domain-containing protein [Clostridia bacterium]|nr:WYL domain-containing protein [Clostridia bacterium]
MTKTPNQKFKILYLMKYLLENSDEDNPVTMGDILAELDSYGIRAERKSVYDDIEALRVFGLDIIGEKRSSYVYYIGSRNFELPELKLLVDSVGAARFISEKKSAALIKKLESLTSHYQAHKLQRQVYIVDRAKTINEMVYLNIDKIYDAINSGRQIAFKYFEYRTDKQRHLRNDGNDYAVSPYCLTVSEDNYYLVSHYHKHEKLTHFRVDRMTDLRVLEDKATPVQEVAGANFNLGEYSRRIFNMYSGETVLVTLRCEKSLVNAVIDKFGQNVSVRDCGDFFTVKANVNISPTFFAWVFMFEGKMKIEAPEAVVTKFRETIENFM